jgi:hypothetical protein
MVRLFHCELPSIVNLIIVPCVLHLMALPGVVDSQDQ